MNTFTESSTVLSPQAGSPTLLTQLRRWWFLMGSDPMTSSLPQFTPKVSKVPAPLRFPLLYLFAPLHGRRANQG